MTATVRINLYKALGILIFLAAAVILIKPTFAQDATSTSTARKDKIEARKTAIQQKIETRKENIQNKIAAVREKMASREAALKAKLEAFKDKRKAQIAERVNTNLNKINENQTSQMLKHLERMTTLLDKLENRVNSGSADIKDPTTARVAITEARAKIAAATEAVNAQAQKDYTLTVTSESKVKADAQSMRDQLKTDLQAVRKQVIEAKQSVANAIRTAKSGQKEATNSGQ